MRFSDCSSDVCSFDLRARRRRDRRTRRSARPGSRSGSACGRLHQVTDPNTGPALALPILDEELATRLKARLVEVEEALTGHIRSETEYVTTAARHLLHAGGKGFRPLPVLLAAEGSEGRREGNEVVS